MTLFEPNQKEGSNSQSEEIQKIFIYVIRDKNKGSKANSKKSRENDSQKTVKFYSGK